MGSHGVIDLFLCQNSPFSEDNETVLWGDIFVHILVQCNDFLCKEDFYNTARYTFVQLKSRESG